MSLEHRDSAPPSKLTLEALVGLIQSPEECKNYKLSDPIVTEILKEFANYKDSQGQTAVKLLIAKKLGLNSKIQLAIPDLMNALLHQKFIIIKNQEKFLLVDIETESILMEDNEYSNIDFELNRIAFSQQMQSAFSVGTVKK